MKKHCYNISPKSGDRQMRFSKCFSVVLVLVAFTYGQSLTKFSAGSAAKAGEVYGNDSLLLAKINALQAKCDSVANVKTTLPIGTIVTSILDSGAFNKVAGAGWVLADGRGGSFEYFSTTGNTNIPDLRGVFLRGVNAGRTDGNQDPDASRLVGSFQTDSIISHSHSGATSTNGSHTHTGSTSLDGNHSHSMTFRDQSEGYVSVRGTNWPGDGHAINSSTNGAHSHSVSVTANGDHSHALNINNYGGSETRPKNVAVYYYIKVK
jgi:hypothetical protein